MALSCQILSSEPFLIKGGTCVLFYSILDECSVIGH